MFRRIKAKAILTLTLALLVGGVATAKSPTASPTPAATPAAAGQFVSNDKKDSPFHKSTCGSCKQIKKPQYYATKEDAVKAGHKPCKNCKP